MRACLIVLGLLMLAGCEPAADKESEADLAVCGGVQGLACGAGQYCAYPQTGFCGVADQTGVCMPRPQACTMDYNPVCGCNDVIYPNECAAASAGTSIAYPGECQP